MVSYKDMRTEMGMSQQEVADVLGINRSYFCYIENYKRNFNLLKAIEFAKLYQEKTGKQLNFISDIRHY